MKVHEYMKTYNSFSGTDMVATMYLPGVEGVEGAITLGSLQTISYSIHMDRSPVRAISNINAKTYVMGQRTIAGSLVFAVFDRHFAYEAMRKLKGSDTNFYFLADELPPFDITITFANEYGQRAKLAIYGVRLIDEGQVMSINDILTENTYQFVATDIDLLSDNNSSANGGLIYEGLHPNQPITEAVEIDWQLPSAANVEEITSEYDFALRATTVKAPTLQNKNGMAEISFYGETPTGGKIIVYYYQEVNSEGKWIYSTSILCTPHTDYPAQVALPTGNYKVQYFDINEKIRSKQVEFAIPRYTAETYVPAPTISSTTVDGIVLNIGDNVEEILFMKKGSKDWRVKPVTNNNKKMAITKLDADSVYFFKAKIGSNESSTTEGHTLAYVDKLLKEFEQYLMANLDLLTEHGLSVMKVKIVAQKAYDIQLANLKLGLNLPIAHAVQAALKELGTGRNRSIETVTNKDINILSLEAARFENRYAEVINKETACVTIVDMIRGHFLAPLDTKQLIIESGDAPKRIIALSKMKKMPNGYLYESILDPGVYEVYSINTAGLYTSKVTFVALTDDVKREMLNRQNAIEKDKAYISKIAMEEMANFTGQVDNTDQLYRQWGLMQNLTQSDAIQPDIIEVKYDTVTLQPVSPENVLPETLYLCFEEIDKAADQNTCRKMLVSRSNLYAAKLTIKEHCLVKGRRYAAWYQEISSAKNYRPTCFLFDEDYEEDACNSVCAKKDKSILLKTLYTLAVKTNTTELLDYINDIVNSVFEDSTQNLEKSINNIIETMYNENMLTKKNLCESICLVFTARNMLLSRYNNEDLSLFATKGNLAKSCHIQKTAYLKRFIVNEKGVVYLEPLALAPGQYFALDYYTAKDQIIGFYLIESDKEKVGLPTIMDASEHLFYGRRTINDYQ